MYYEFAYILNRLLFSEKNEALFIIYVTLNLPPAFARTRTHKQTCSPSLPHVQAAGAICPPAPGTGKAQRSHTAQSHTSSPRAHRSQPDRWTLMAAWTVFVMACLKYDGTLSQQKTDFDYSVAVVFFVLQFMNLPFPTPAI